MALTFPLPLTEFFDILRAAEATISCPTIHEQSMTGAGEVLTRALGPSLWQGSVTIATNKREELRGVRGLVDAVTRGSFMARDLSYVGPHDDPTGAIFSGAAVTMNSVLANGDVRFAGLPANYQLRAGDYFSLTYGSGPVRNAMHQLQQDTRASAGGQSAYAAVHPPIRPGWTTSTAIRFIRPVCKAVIVPGSITEAPFDGIASSGLSFRWQQTLR